MPVVDQNSPPRRACRAASKAAQQDDVQRFTCTPRYSATIPCALGRVHAPDNRYAMYAVALRRSLSLSSPIIMLLHSTDVAGGAHLPRRAWSQGRLSTCSVKGEATFSQNFDVRIHLDRFSAAIDWRDQDLGRNTTTLKHRTATCGTSPATS